VSPGTRFDASEVTRTPRLAADRAAAPSSRAAIELLWRWLEADVNGFRLVAVYAPESSGRLRLQTKRAFWQALLSAAGELRETRALLVGDFNTGTHRVDEAAATFYCANDFVDLERCAHSDLE